MLFRKITPRSHTFSSATSFSNNMIKQKKQAEVDFFDRYGKELEFDAFDERGYKRLIDECLKHVKPADNFKVLELGCATGCFTGRLANYKFNITAVDISPNCINFAKEKYPDINFEVGDIEHLKYADASFDAVVLFGVLHHFPDLSIPLRESYRLLKKGGTLFAYDPHICNPFTWIYRSKSSPFYSSEGVTENESPLTKKEIRGGLGANGFVDYSVYCISGVTFNNKCQKFAPIVATMMRFYNVIERIIDFWPIRELLGSSILTVARK